MKFLDLRIRDKKELEKNIYIIYITIELHIFLVTFLDYDDLKNIIYFKNILVRFRTNNFRIRN